MTWQSCFLLASILLPLAGVGVIRCLPAEQAGRARWMALAVSLVVMALASVVTYDCVVVGNKSAAGDSKSAALDYTATRLEFPWLSGKGASPDDPIARAPNPLPPSVPASEPSQGSLPVKFSLGLDGLGLWLYVLSALLMITCILVSWEAVSERTVGFYSMLLILETGMLGVFAARDLILFYVFFEATLIPLYFLIGIWGGEQRRWAAIKFFIFTLAGSMLTFLGLLMVVVLHYQGTGDLTFSIAELTDYLRQNPPSLTVQIWIFLALFAGFAIKVPLFPFHTWLPLAHVEAPTAGSILLAGVLLKIGTYGFVRFNLSMFPAASLHLAPWILSLSTAGIIYGALVALAQKDIKKLIAYSSVSHLGLCMMGMFSLNAAGLTGSALQMVGHGLSTGGLFAVVGMLYERYHTRQIADYGGMARKMPILAFFLLLLTFASVGVPATSGFAAEFPALMGLFQRAYHETAAARTEVVIGGSPVAPLYDLRTYYIFLAVVAAIGMIFSAWYMLYLIQRIMFGKFKEPAHGHASHGAHGHGSHGHASHGHDSHGPAAPAKPTATLGHVAVGAAGLGNVAPGPAETHGHAAPAHAAHSPAAHGHADAHAAHGHDDHGHHHEEDDIPDSGIPDLCLREVFALAPLIVVIFWIGLCPQVFVKPLLPTLNSALAEVRKTSTAALARDSAPAGALTSDAIVMGATRRD